MNTVGKKDRLGEQVRCVVSVSMLTEGWDANTVTHILGVRAFGTQLLCEQVVGRGLRRQSYELNSAGLFDPEYADILGIPFDFTAKPVVAKPKPPKPTVRVHAVRPERDHLELTFPRVIGYRTEIPQGRFNASFSDNSTFTLTPHDFPLSLTTSHQAQVTLHGVDVFKPSTGEVVSSGPEGIACWFIDSDYNGESFFVRHAYFLGQQDPYKALKTTLKAEIDEDAWATLHSDSSRPFPKPATGRIAVKVINHLGDEVMKVFAV